MTQPLSPKALHHVDREVLVGSPAAFDTGYAHGDFISTRDMRTLATVGA